MQWPYPPPHDDPDFEDEDARKQRANILVLAIAAGLVLASVVLLFWLKDRTDLQDCIRIAPELPADRHDGAVAGPG